MKLLSKIDKAESGQAFILVLILLLVGGLMVPPLLGFMGTGLKANQLYEEKIDGVYAADAGVEDAIYRIIKDDTSLQNLDDGDSYSYSLPSSVNNLSVDITVTKLSLIQGILGEDEYKLNQPHESWVQFEIPPEQVVRNYDEGWVEYYCEITFYYDGNGKRKIESVGAFFSPFPGDESLIEGPYDETATPVITFDNLESFETKAVSGGFAFIWRWQHNSGPEFNKNNRDGSLNFKFKVYDPDWEYAIYFVWATFKEQDISYVTNADFYKWLIEVVAGNTTVKSSIIKDANGVDVLTWEINPPH